MKRFLTISYLLSSVLAFGQSVLPSAPIPVNKTKETRLEHRIRLGILGGLAVTRTLDWTSTQSFLSKPTNCTEGNLPLSLAKSKTQLGLFEGGAFATEFVLSRLIAKKHPKLSITGSGIDLFFMTKMVVGNYGCHGLNSNSNTTPTLTNNPNNPIIPIPMPN